MELMQQHNVDRLCIYRAMQELIQKWERLDVSFMYIASAIDCLAFLCALRSKTLCNSPKLPAASLEASMTTETCTENT